MGFGRGIDEEARRGRVYAMAHGLGVFTGWTDWEPSRNVDVLATFGMILLRVPSGTPDPIDLMRLQRVGAGDMRDEATLARLRDAHAAKLVTPVHPSGLVAQRSVTGDARDLLDYVLRRALSDVPGDPTQIRAGARTIALLTAQNTDVQGESPDRHALFIHIGATEEAQRILRAVRVGDSAWDGDLNTLDGDGYVHLLVRERAAPWRSHLVLAGGSPYGTCFAVSTFVQQHLGVRWLFPGALGEIIPRVGALRLGEVDWFEEPAVRSRTLAAISSESVHTAGELDEIRAWQLRNRLRPHEDMARLFQKVHARSITCATPRPTEFLDGFIAAAIEVEERVPTDHMLHRFLSPYQRAPGATLQRIATRSVNYYPDLRFRHASFFRFTNSAGLPVIVPSYGTRGVQQVHTELGLQGDVVAFSETADNCADPPTECCRAQPTPSRLRQILRAVRGPSGLLANFETALGDTFSHRLADPGLVANGLVRFVPRTFTQALEGDLFTFGNWHPCIFDFDAAPLGTPKRARDSLVGDIALQLATSAHGRQLRGRDFTHSVSFDDLNTWCQCDACIRVDDDGGPGNDLTLYQGHLIARPSIALEREAELSVVFSGLRLSTVVDSRTAWVRSGTGGMRETSATFFWETNTSHNPFAHMTFGDLAACGVVWSQGYQRTRTRRVLTLLNAVSETVQQIVNGDYVSEQLRTWNGQSAPAVVFNAPEFRWPVLGFHAYAEYMAPPISLPPAADGTRALGEYCHPFLMPYMTGVRDTVEYRPDATNPYEAAARLPATTQGALARMLAAPDQFNHERWSRIARRTGLYEYISSAGYVGPHLYTARLHGAIRNGLRHHRLRGFICEAAPNWCFDAPMLWELPRMLWDPGPLVGNEVAAHLSALRGDFCTAAFGAAAAPMQAFFDLCEEAWAATRDGWTLYELALPTADGSRIVKKRPYPDRRLRSGAASGFFGDGYGGRGNWLSTLDGFLGAPSVRGGARTRLLQCWALLNQAVASPALDEPTRERVQLFRRSFGLTLLIGLWYEPLRMAFEAIRFQRVDMVRMQKIIQLRERVMTVSGATEPMVTVAPAVPSGPTEVTVHTGYVRPTGTKATRAELGRTRREALRNLILPDGRNGLRELRNEVHRYLALSISSPTERGFPTFARHATELGSLANIGLGLFAQTASSLATDAAFPGMGSTMAGPHRLMGLWLPGLAQYVDWWNNIPRGADEDMNSNVLTQRVRLLPPFAPSTSAPDPGFGWIFTGLKDLAGATLLYADDLADDRRDAWIAALVRG